MSSFASSSTIFARDEVENATVEALLRTGNVCCETWLFKKGGGSTLLGRRAWRRRYFVLVSSRDASEPSALFWFDGPPAFLPDEHIDADEVLEGIPKPKGAILLDDPACAARAVAAAADEPAGDEAAEDATDNHGRHRFGVSHPRHGERFLAANVGNKPALSVSCDPRSGPDDARARVPFDPRRRTPLCATRG